MDYPLRSIAYVAELIHPPRQHAAQDLQRMHAAIFADPKCPYQNFNLLPGGAAIYNPPTQANMVSSLTILQDRVQVREELSGISREDFQERVERIATHSFAMLGIQQFAMQSFVVRSLVNARNFYDSREFISRSLLNMEEDDFVCLQRAPQIVGLRFVFPQTNETRGMFNIRIESYAAEPRSLFIENVGIFRSLITDANINELTSNFFSTYDYLDGNVVDFIAQFDTREEPPSK